MNRDFFASFDQRKTDFAARAGIDTEIRADLVLGNGRVYMIDRIVETDDAWLHVDVRDLDDETVVRSLVLPYYQVQYVLFSQKKPRVRQAGFSA